MPGTYFRKRSQSLSAAQRNDRAAYQLDPQPQHWNKTDDDFAGSTYIPNSALLRSAFWHTSAWSPLRGRSILTKYPEYFNLSSMKMIETALEMSSGSEVIMSFGARDGGFDFAESLRDRIYQEVFQQNKDKDKTRAYLDYYSLQEHPATRYPWNSDTKKGNMQNPFWDIAYKNGLDNAKIMIFNISLEWLRSNYCYEEFEWFLQRKKRDSNFRGVFLFNLEAQDFMASEGRAFLVETASGIAAVRNSHKTSPELYQELCQALTLPNVSRLNVGGPLSQTERVARPGPLDERGATGKTLTVKEQSRFTLNETDISRVISTVKSLLESTPKGP